MINNNQQQTDHARLAALVEASDDAIVAEDLDGIVFAWNDSAQRLFQYSAEEIIGQPITTICPMDRLAEEATIFARIRRGEHPGRYVSECRTKDGRKLPVSITILPLRASDGAITGASTIIRDLTESGAREQRIRELQAELALVQRLSEVGQMVSALVHEVNQPLTAITNYLGACRRLVAAGNHQAIGQVLERIEGQANRTHAIIQRMRNFVGKRQPELRRENLAQVVNEAIELTRASTRDEGLTLTTRLDPETAVNIDRVQVQQVLFNLLRNGIEAMQDQQQRAIVIATQLRAAGMVEISVADCGPGLPPEVRDKLFQAFVTTKTDGMGVGLSVCRTIVEAHSGQIWADAGGGGSGTVFRFTLPIAG